MTKKKTALVKIGRPTVFTPEVVRKLEEAFMFDATDGEACAFAGIGETAYYDEKVRNPAFADRMHRAQQFPFMLAKKTVLKAIEQDDGALAMKWLKNRQRDRYHEKVEQQVVEPPVDHAEVLAEEMIARAAAKAPPPADANPS